MEQNVQLLTWDDCAVPESPTQREHGSRWDGCIDRTRELQFHSGGNVTQVRRQARVSSSQSTQGVRRAGRRPSASSTWFCLRTPSCSSTARRFKKGVQNMSGAETLPARFLAIRPQLVQLPAFMGR